MQQSHFLFREREETCGEQCLQIIPTNMLQLDRVFWFVSEARKAHVPFVVLTFYGVRERLVNEWYSEPRQRSEVYMCVKGKKPAHGIVSCSLSRTGGLANMKNGRRRFWMYVEYKQSAHEYNLRILFWQYGADMSLLRFEFKYSFYTSGRKTCSKQVM
jgi:hypothetical protein